MKRRLIVNASISVSALIVSVAVFSCRTRPPRATAKDVDGLIADARALSPILESKCSSCHNQGGENGQMPAAWYNAMARATQPIEQCLETNRCYESPIPTGNEATCWQCVTVNGLPSMNGGIFHAAIRGGIVKTLADVNHIPQATLDSYMPMPMGVNDGANDISPGDLRSISQWLKNEALNNFVGIEAIRPVDPGHDDHNNDAMACDSFHSSIAPMIIDNFRRDRMPMFGCRGNGWPSNPNTCLQSFPDLPVAHDTIPGLVVKELRKFAPGVGSSYWTRSSPDGRFSSTGNGKIHDLKTPGRTIEVTNNDIDPIYSPDGRYYSWPSMICPMDPLYDLATTAVGTGIASSGCKNQNFGAYRSLGADPSGDTLLIKSYDSNNGGSPWPSGKTDARSIHGSSNIDILRVSNNQIGQSLASTSITNEGSYQIGPSGQLIVGHFSNDQLGEGYRVRNIRPSGGAVDLSHGEQSGFICMHGEKPTLSFDNRFVVFHHYTDNSPQDTGAVAETANIFIYDLKTKKGYRVTNMPAKGRAFFPHFRADGWLYFLTKQVDEGGTVTESILATNAAILLKAQQ